MAIPTRKNIKKDLVSLLSEVGPTSTLSIYSSLATKWALTAEEINAKRSGASLYQNEVRWARQELAIEGVIARPSDSGRGIWKLSDGLSLSIHEGQDENNEIDPELTYTEGSVKKISVNAFERSTTARKACLEHHGYKCVVCMFDFESVYGEIGRERIHVHHLLELSSIRAEYVIRPINDLVPICPNCHYIAHQRRPSFSIEELKSMIAANASAQQNSTTPSSEFIYLL